MIDQNPMRSWFGALAIVGAATTAILLGDLYFAEARDGDFFGIYVLGVVIGLLLAAIFALVVSTPVFLVGLHALAKLKAPRPLGDIALAAGAALLGFIASPIVSFQAAADVSWLATQLGVAALLGASVGLLYWLLSGRPRAAP